jgi:type I restriction enzyme S subunit
MTNGYPQRRLGEFVTVQGGFAFKSQDFKRVGVPVLKIKNVRQRDVDTSDVDYVDEELAKATARYFCKTGDLLISMTGSGPQAPNSVVGRVARYTGPSEKFLINQRVGRFLIKHPSELDARYLFFVLTQPEYQWNLVSIATGSANQVNISPSQIENLEVPFPLPSEQRAIAAVLGALDDKIELNQRANQTLATIAQALFRSWFVDFDPVRAKAAGEVPFGLDDSAADLFPDSFQESPLGLVPVGWNYAPLGACRYTQILGSGIREFTGSKTYFATADVERGRIVGRGEEIQFSSRPSRANMQPTLNTVWFAKMKESPKYLFINQNRKWIAERCVLSTGFAGLRCAAESGAFVYTFVSSQEFDADKNRLSIGTTMQAVNNELIQKIWILNPPPPVVSAFSTQAAAIYEQVAQNENECRALAEVRDTILPKLLSRELPVANLTLP